MAAKTDTQSFWEHLDVLWAAIVRIAAVAAVFGIAAFFFKEELFAVVLAPKDDGFVTYRLFGRIAAWAGGAVEPFSVRLINTELAQQFVIHMKTALCAGVLCASPYILLTFRFLGTYQVSGEVDNLIALDSYISTLVTMCLAMGIVFEIPMLSWLFARLGFLSADFMRCYRKHAIVIILVVAAIITPTSDVFTLSLVALPMWGLYEASLLIVRRIPNRKA